MPAHNYSPEALAAITDGCSGGISWLHKRLFGRDVACVYCCDEHDVAYFEGGTSAARSLADARLRQCVAASGRPLAAWIMWVAVRAMGWRHWGQA